MSCKAHLTVMRSEGSGRSIWGRRALNIVACGIRRPSTVLRTPRRPSGRLRTDLRSSMASEACGKTARGRLLAFLQLEESAAAAAGRGLGQAPGVAMRGVG